MAILTRTSAADLMNRPDLLSDTDFPDVYLDGVFASVEGGIERFLHWNPTLHYWQDETGVAQFVQGGTYAGRYMVELRNQPLVPGEAPDIFTKFALKYPLTVPMSADVALEFVKVFNDTGQVFCLAPGAVEALVATFFGMAPVMQRVTAVAYAASYLSGYACNNGTDPINPITNAAFVGVPPLPAPILDAAVLLVRERLSVDAVMNKNLDNPMAGVVYRIRVGEREQVYRPIARAGATGALGMGTPLAQSAEALLAPYVKRHTPYFL